MIDPRVQKLARVLVEYCVKVKPGDRVAVMSSTEGQPLILEVGREVLRAGGHPHILPQLDGWEYIFFSEASDEQLAYISPFTKQVMFEFECLINLRAPTNTKDLANIDPKHQSLHARAMRPIMDRYRERYASGELRWVISLFPTQAMAQDAEMSLPEFEDFVYRATHVDRDDPVGAWKDVHDSQQRLVDWLVGKHEIHAIGPNVDLKLSIEGRQFRNSDGDRNMPSGEIFTSPVEDSVEGWYRGSYPAFIRGREVHGLELRFEGGVVVEAKSERNQVFLEEMLDLDEGSRRLGEFAIGTNNGIQRFTRNILFDEKIGGSMHIALGSSFAELGGLNKSSLHWDI
ncbi:MAG: aminopeptidase, partial [Anaerolineales bacterium]|nr:aminopeptidase [Anaerolineales bacterium]